MYRELVQKKKLLAVVGLGYVGLPLALAFAKRLSVIGFDIHAQRVAMMKKGIDPSKELPKSAFEGCDIRFTADQQELKAASFFVIAVPTPIDQHKIPNLQPLLSACETVGSVLKKGDYVIFESTVYPGCTEEDCVPLLEHHSGLKFKSDFQIGYSPERINPGDKKHTLEKIVKVVSGSDAQSLEMIAQTYELIIKAGVHRATSIKVAEAAKVIENTQRDLNIALMNELSIIFDKMNIDTTAVLEAARTKWNFLNFYPGLVGGHCIGVDPYYLTYKAQKLGYNAQVILSGRRINDGMATYVATKTVQLLIRQNKHPKEAKVLIMGVTFKENVADIRNSKVADLVASLKEFRLTVDVCDPHADAQEVEREYGFTTVTEIDKNYDAIVIAVAHEEYKALDASYFKQISAKNPILIDLKGIYNDLDKAHFVTWKL